MCYVVSDLYRTFSSSFSKLQRVLIDLWEPLIHCDVVVAKLKTRLKVLEIIWRILSLILVEMPKRKSWNFLHLISFLNSNANLCRCIQVDLSSRLFENQFIQYCWQIKYLNEECFTKQTSCYLPALNGRKSDAKPSYFSLKLPANKSLSKYLICVTSSRFEIIHYCFLVSSERLCAGIPSVDRSIDNSGYVGSKSKVHLIDILIISPLNIK